MSRSPLRVRRLAVAAVVPLAFVSLTACGGDTGKDDAEAAATASTSASSTATSSSSASADVEAAAGETLSTDDFMQVFQAAFDQATTAKITMKVTSGSTTMSGTGLADYTTTPPTMQLQMSDPTGGSGSMEVRMVDGQMYMKLPTMGDKFLSFSLTGKDNPLGGVLTDQLDPRSTFDVFRKAITKATYDGKDDVDGESMDKYTVVLNAAKMAGSLKGLGSAASSQMPKSMTYELWFDGDGHYRQMVAQMGKSIGDMTMTYSDWGTKVSITAPPKSQTTSMPDMSGMGG